MSVGVVGLGYDGDVDVGDDEGDVEGVDDGDGVGVEGWRGVVKGFVEGGGLRMWGDVEYYDEEDIVDENVFYGVVV